MVAFIASIGLQLFIFVINKVLYIKIPHRRRVVLQYATIANNSAFMGLPVIGAVYGPDGVLFASIMLIPMRIFMWVVGLPLFTSVSVKECLKMIATHPCIWAVVLGFAYIFAPFELPEFFTGAVTTIGDCATVLPMLIVGSILCDVKVRDIIDKDCFYFSAFRLFIIPAALYVAMTLLDAGSLVKCAVVVSSAMPAAITTAMLAEKYGQDSAFASKAIIVSTVLSIATLPAIVYFLSVLP